MNGPAVDHRTTVLNSAAPDDCQGFTLVELVVVCVLLAVMAGVLYGTLTGILSGRAVIEAQRSSTATALSALDSISRDLTARVLVPLRDGTLSGNATGVSSPGTFGASGASGVGNPFGLSGGLGGGGRGYFLGDNKKEGAADADVLKFSVNELPGDSRGFPPNYGLVEVTYVLEEIDREEAIEFAEEIPSGRSMFRLVRYEAPAEVSEKTLIELRSHRTVLADRVAGFNVRYLRNGTWEKTWKASSAPVPEAVEVTVQMFGSEGEIEQFRTAVAVSKRVRQR